VNGFNAFVPTGCAGSRCAASGAHVGERDHQVLPAHRTRRGSPPRLPGQGARLEFAALDFTAPHRNRFAYRSRASTPTGPAPGRRSVTYTNLNAGRYTFRLRAANGDGRWNEDGLAVGVEVAAAPWASPWAYAVYLLLLAGVSPGSSASSSGSSPGGRARRLLELKVQGGPASCRSARSRSSRANEELERPASPTRSRGSPTGASSPSTSRRRWPSSHRRTPPGRGALAELLDMAFVMIDLDTSRTSTTPPATRPGTPCSGRCGSCSRPPGRSSDIIVRWGGDEFLLVARELSGTASRSSRSGSAAEWPAHLRRRSKAEWCGPAVSVGSPATRSSRSSSTR